MLSIFKYSAVNSKIRAMYGRLLTREDYDEMTSKTSVRDVAAYLKNSTGYGELLSGINENMIHRGELEKLLNTSLLEDYQKLIRYLRGKPEIFIDASFLRYEIEDLKMILRILSTGYSRGLMEDSLIFLRKYSDIDVNKLMKSTNITEFIENLRGTDYYKVLSPFLAFPQRQTLFDMEMALDLHFFTSILRLKDKLLAGEDRESISESFGTQIDVLNIIWIYRCKKLFNFSKEAALSNVIPHWYRLTRKQLLLLAGSSSIKELEANIAGTKYRDVFRPDNEQIWESSYMNLLYKLYRNQLYRGYYNLGQVTAYLHLKEIDIRNIITIIEGIRYSLPKEEIRRHITGYSYLR